MSHRTRMTLAIAAAVRAITPMASVASWNQVARSPVDEDVQIPPAVQDPLALLSSGLAPDTWASRPYAR
jgi:hypothetical protein